MTTIAALADAAADAATRIASVIRRTPLSFSPRWSEITGARVWFKLENLQLTGSFKLRGAANRLLALSDAERRAGCVAASSGNHGAAVAYAMAKLGIDGVIFVPQRTSVSKLDAIRAFGGSVEFHGSDGLDTELYAKQYAESRGMTYVSPYNDAAVVAGQGTCGIEIVDELPDVDALFVSIGGGGLVSGVGSVLRTRRPGVAIVGSQPRNSPVMTRSIEAGRIVDLPSEPTLSDGTAGGVEPDALTFDLCRELVDDFVLVDEADIARAMRDFIDTEHQVIEGAAGVAVAALQKRCNDFAGKNVVVLICGANISRDRLAEVLTDD